VRSKKTRDPLVQEFFQSATPEQQHTFFESQYLNTPPPPHIIQAIALPGEELTPYHEKETLSEIENLRFAVCTCLTIKQHPNVRETTGELTNCSTYNVSEKATRKILRTIPRELRLTLAHMLSIQCMERDDELCRLYNEETGNNLICAFPDDDPDPDDEEYVIVGAWEERDDETYLQARFEYARLREAFDALIENRILH